MVYAIILFLHLLGAAVWTGGHLVLATTWLPRVLKSRSPEMLLTFEQGFEKIGMPALITQVLTGGWLISRFVSGVSFSDLFSFESSVYQAAGLKIILLSLTILLALNARFRVIPNLSPANLHIMAWHIVLVTIISVLFVFVGVSFKFGGIGVFWS